jgi:hypothetical protein
VGIWVNGIVHPTLFLPDLCADIRYLVWDTLEQRNVFFGKENSSGLLFEPLHGNSTSTIQARLTELFIDVLSAPTTEFVTLKLKPGRAKGGLDSIVDELRGALRKGVANGCHGNSYGPSVQQPDEVVVGIVGWDSVAVSPLLFF